MPVFLLEEIILGYRSSESDLLFQPIGFFLLGFSFIQQFLSSKPNDSDWCFGLMGQGFTVQSCPWRFAGSK